jgi:integron integrase
MSKLLDQVRSVLRLKHYSDRTEETYVHWIVRYILYHNKRHPNTMNVPEIEQFLSYLASDLCVSASTQNIALAAIQFLYREVLHIELYGRVNAARAKRSETVPTVLSRQEVEQLLSNLRGEYRLMAQLLYGGGLRLMECLRLRVKDIDFDNLSMTIRDGKGENDRTTLLPRSVVADLQAHLRNVEEMHQRDLKAGYGAVLLYDALARKYPNASREWGWQWVFPSLKISEDPRTPGIFRRHHAHESGLQRAIRDAARKAGITKTVGPHTLRHSFATHLLENGVSIDTVKDLLGHKDIRTTMRYAHVAQITRGSIRSPLDNLQP